jgi:hypothetical protein
VQHGVDFEHLYGPRWGRIRKLYAKLLRRAARVGWVPAKREYVESERLFGRSLDDIHSELELLEHLNSQARERGIDPVAAQKRRDLYERYLRPLIITWSVLYVVMRASQGATFPDTLVGALLLCWLGLGVCKACLSPAPT